MLRYSDFKTSLIPTGFSRYSDMTFLITHTGLKISVSRHFHRLVYDILMNFKKFLPIITGL